MSNARKKRFSARFVAAEILQELTVYAQPIKPVFDRLTRQASLATKDRALTMELTYGVLRHKQNLDRALELLSNTPIKKLDPFIHQVLAVGLYQLLFLDRIPDSAAVNEAVQSCKAKQNPKPIPQRLHGFVNGILRQATREKKKLTEQMTKDSAGHTLLNHPHWLNDRWQTRFGKEAARAICTINNTPPLLSLRINSSKIHLDDFCASLDEKGYFWKKGAFAPNALLLPRGTAIEAIPGWEKGYFQVQDQAAQLASLLLGPFNEPEQYILDACAGLGGKTSHLLELMSGGELHAVEPASFRAEKLLETIRRLGGKISLHQTDLLTLSPSSTPTFHRILIDAPCSGTGVTRRHPDIRWNRSLKEIKNFQKQQQALLHHSTTLAAEKAVLVYATCSLEEEENDAVITAFLSAHPDFQLSDPAPFLPEAAHRFLRGFFFAPQPGEEIDGFFAARLERT